MNVNQKGVIGLTKVTADLVERGYEVFLPVSDASTVDLIAADSDQRLCRLQVKYRNTIQGKFVGVPFSSVVNGKRVPTNLTHLDGWVIYNPDLNEVYYVRSDELVGKGLRLAVSDYPKRTVRLASGFRDPSRLWDKIGR